MKSEKVEKTVRLILGENYKLPKRVEMFIDHPEMICENVKKFNIPTKLYLCLEKIIEGVAIFSYIFSIIFSTLLETLCELPKHQCTVLCKYGSRNSKIRS